MIRSLRFLNTRLNVQCEDLQMQEGLRFFAPHFELSSEAVEHPDATVELRRKMFELVPGAESVPRERVWIRKSHSRYFSVSAKRFEQGGQEELVCDDTGTHIRYEPAGRRICVCLTPDTRPIELIEVVRDIVLKNEELAGTIVLHAAVVAGQAGAVIIVGGKGAGKTTLALELIREHGYELVSGDKALLCVDSKAEDVRVCGWPDWPNIGLGTLQKYPPLAVELGVSRRIAEAEPEDLWSVAHKIAVPPEVISRHFRVSERQGALPIVGICYPRIGPAEELTVLRLADHYPFAEPHMERAFHARSDWNHFTRQDDRARTRVLRHLPSLWNRRVGYSIVGKGNLSMIPPGLEAALS